MRQHHVKRDPSGHLSQAVLGRRNRVRSASRRCGRASLGMHARGERVPDRLLGKCSRAGGSLLKGGQKCEVGVIPGVWEVGQCRFRRLRMPWLSRESMNSLNM